MMLMPTRPPITRAQTFALTDALAQAIRVQGTIASTMLYERLAGHVEFHIYQCVIRALIHHGLVEASLCGELTWIGPLTGIPA